MGDIPWILLSYVAMAVLGLYVGYMLSRMEGPR